LRIKRSTKLGFMRKPILLVLPVQIGRRNPQLRTVLCTDLSIHMNVFHGVDQQIITINITSLRGLDKTQAKNRDGKNKQQTQNSPPIGLQSRKQPIQAQAQRAVVATSFT